MSESELNNIARGDQVHFDSTRWSLVRDAAGDSSQRSHEALATLCQTYWFPLYAYVRRRVRDVHEAQDLTQEFFARLLEKNYLSEANPARGKFRSFLITVFKHFLANEWTKARAQKRGGGKSPISLHLKEAESRLSQESTHETPERLYDREWAETLIEHVLALLKADYARSGKEEAFEHLKGFISSRGSRESYRELAPKLGITDSAARVAAYRLRRRYRELLRRQIAETVSSPEEVEDEIRSLFLSLGSHNSRKSGKAL